MTQHITVVRGTDGQPVASPAIAGVWRDDQTVMWGVSEDYAWDSSKGNPIQFGFDQPGFDNWTGSPPSPVGPVEGEWDKRYYVALANRLNESSLPMRYVYTMYVIHIPSQTSLRVGIEKQPQPEIVDPVIDNHPEP